MNFHKVLLTVFSFIFIFTLLDHPVDAKVYKWKDENGKIYFTDSLSKVPYKYRKNIKPPARKSYKKSGQGLEYKIKSISYKRVIGLGPRYTSDDPYTIRRPWKLMVINNNSSPMTFNAEISFMDSAGVTIHRERMYNLRIQENTKKVFTEYANLKPSIGKEIKKVSANISNDREFQGEPIPIKVNRGKYVISFRNLKKKPIVFRAKILFLDGDGFALERKYLYKEYLKVGKKMSINVLNLFPRVPYGGGTATVTPPFKKLDVILKIL